MACVGVSVCVRVELKSLGLWLRGGVVGGKFLLWLVKGVERWRG